MRACVEPDEIIARPDVDVVDICTPNIYHYDMLKKAIAAKKHIYCEKPLCITPEQADEVAELAERADIRAQVVSPQPLLPRYAARQTACRRGPAGQDFVVPLLLSPLERDRPDKNAGWKQNRDICGGGVLFDLGSHALDLVYYLCGEYRSVVGRGQIAYPRPPRHGSAVSGRPTPTRRFISSPSLNAARSALLRRAR